MEKDKSKRKEIPIYNGLLMYFPDACAAVANCSYIANEQHNPGTKMHWDRSKSGDEHDALVRHLLEAGTVDDDGIKHSTKVAWRALAALQKEIECMEHTNVDNEIGQYKDEDRWWKWSAITILIVFIGYLVARSVISLIFGV